MKKAHTTTTHCASLRRAKLGKGPKPMPRLLGTALAWLLTRVGPRGMEFARYSLDYHVIRQGMKSHACILCQPLPVAVWILHRHKSKHFIPSRQTRHRRNYLHVVRTWGKERAARHVPAYAKQIVADYDAKGAISAR